MKKSTKNQKIINLLSLAILILLFITISTTRMFCQQYVWGKQLKSRGAFNSFSPKTHISDRFGNTYMAEIVYDTVDVDPSGNTVNLIHTSLGTPNGPSVDMFIAKYDPLGNYLWSTQIKGNGTNQITSIGLDAAENIYASGYFAGTADFDASAGGVANLTTLTGYNTFIAKYDSSGNYIWAKQILGDQSAPLSENFAISQQIDNSSNIYLMGFFYGTSDFNPGVGVVNITANSTDLFIAKYDSGGSLLWVKNLGGAQASFLANLSTSNDNLKIDSHKNLYIMGLLYQMADFDPGVGVANLGTNNSTWIPYMAKYDSAGNYLWANTIGNATTNFTGINYTDMNVDNTGNIYTAGFFDGTVDFDPGAGLASVSSAGGRDMFFAKYNTNGGYLWVKNMGASGADQIFNINLYKTEGVYITGSFSGTVDFNPSVNTNTLTGVANSKFFAKYDTAGNYVWTENMGNNIDRTYVFSNNQGTIYLTGAFSNTIDLDPSSGTANFVAYPSWANLFFAKYNNCASAPNQPNAIMGSTLNCQGTLHTYSAAAVSSADSYTWTLPNGWSGSSNVDSIIATVGVSSGTIYVTANNACGTSAPQLITVTVTICTGINEERKSIVQYFPNPTNGLFTLDTEEPSLVTIYNTLGDIIYSQQLNFGKNELSLLNQSSGVFIVNVQTKNSSEIFKIIKQE